jgi:hypothetical protein
MSMMRKENLVLPINCCSSARGMPINLLVPSSFWWQPFAEILKLLEYGLGPSTNGELQALLAGIERFGTKSLRDLAVVLVHESVDFPP